MTVLCVVYSSDRRSVDSVTVLCVLYSSDRRSVDSVQYYVLVGLENRLNFHCVVWGNCVQSLFRITVCGPLRVTAYMVL